MLRLRPILLLLCILISTYAPLSVAEEAGKHYLLMNDDKIIGGELVTFDDGFLYFKQVDRILKISPAHFKGIFSSQEDAEKAMIILERFQNPDETIPNDRFKNTYTQAKTLIISGVSEKKIDELFEEVRTALSDPTMILDVNIYKKLSLLSALSSYYELNKRLPKLLNECINENNLKKIPKDVRDNIEIRVETLYYLIEHPYINK